MQKAELKTVDQFNKNYLIKIELYSENPRQPIHIQGFCMQYVSFIQHILIMLFFSN